ncbi:MAG: hypothetical protein ACL93V_02745 [Candidatus Electrothrix sp. YB6]
MEPVIATAIISGILCGATTGAGTVATTELVDAYRRLRGMLQKKFGEDSILLRSIGTLEKRPESKAKQDGVVEDVAEAEADKDAELVKAAEDLLAEVKKQEGGEEAVRQIVNQQVTGDSNIFSGTGNVTVTK